jgi:hypothetical protein
VATDGHESDAGFRTVSGDSDPDGDESDAEWLEPAEDLEPGETVTGLVTQVNPNAGNYSTGTVELVRRDVATSGLSKVVMWLRNSLGSTYEAGAWSEGDQIRVRRLEAETFTNDSGEEVEYVPLEVAVKEA